MCTSALWVASVLKRECINPEVWTGHTQGSSTAFIILVPFKSMMLRYSQSFFPLSTVLGLVSSILLWYGFNFEKLKWLFFFHKIPLTFFLWLSMVLNNLGTQSKYSTKSYHVLYNHFLKCCWPRTILRAKINTSFSDLSVISNSHVLENIKLLLYVILS